MKPPFLGLFVVCLLPLSGFAQERIYRCGNAYSNTAPDAQTLGCKLLEGGHITVIQGTRTMATMPPTPPAAAGAPSAGPRVEAGEQKTRDQEARKILETELKKAELRQFELLKEYKQGAPDKRGDETSQPQKYQDRVAELKAGLARVEADLSGIRRELARLSPLLPPAQVNY
jgi:hypothetical protein